MSARLSSTTLDIANQTVSMAVVLEVQSSNFEVRCVETTATLLQIAQSNGRSDWNTSDCAQAATVLIGQFVELP